MQSLRWARAKGLLELALHGTDSQLRGDVESVSATNAATTSVTEGPAATATRPRGRLVAGTRLGPYEILTLIGAGGMGEVYKAYDTRLHRTVAIKVLRAHCSADPDHRRRFEQEALAVAALMHPHICVLHDVGDHDGIAFFVMECLEGHTLADRLLDGPLPFDDVLRFAAEIADALEAAHRRGIVHRDLKPGNIMLTKDGVKLLDFGLARLLPPLGDDTAAASTDLDSLTAEGTILGTLPYMAPEQLEGGSGDARADIFSFGAMLYEMATGRLVFSGRSVVSLIDAILYREPESLAPMLPPRFGWLIRKCLAKDPGARWQRVADVRDELRRMSPGSSSDSRTLRRGYRRRLLRWTAAALTIPLASGAGAAIRRWSDADPPTAAGLQRRQVTVDGDVVTAALSPDGRMIAYAMGEPGSDVRLMVRDLAGGRALSIWSGQYIQTISWLPDGFHVVVSGERRPDRGTWIVSRRGGAPRLVARRRGIAGSATAERIVVAMRD